MNIPTLPAGRNKYYDLGPTRQYDVDVIRRALLQYEGTMAARVKAAQPDSDERFRLALPYGSPAVVIHDCALFLIFCHTGTLSATQECAYFCFYYLSLCRIFQQKIPSTRKK